MTTQSFVDLGPAVTLYSDALSEPSIYIELAEKYNDWRPGIIQSNNREYRVSSIWSVNPGYADSDVWNNLTNKLSEIGKSYANKNHIPHAKMQGLQLIKYEPGEGFYDWHYDVSYSSDDDAGMRGRVFSMVAYLNDVSSGGETEFKNFNLLVGPRAGSVLMFPANFAYIHRANMPREVPKYIVVTWFEY